MQEIAWIRGEKLFGFYCSGSDADPCANKEGFRGLLQQIAFFVMSKPDMSHLNSRECITTAGQWFAGSRIWARCNCILSLM